MTFYYRHIVLTLIFCVALVLQSCTNPFAPRELKGDILDNLLGDPSTVEGFYTRFQNAYQLRDTSLYGPLIHTQFTFTFRDPEQNVDVSWGRAEEMNTTSRMFQRSRDIQLQWNNVVFEQGNVAQTQLQVVRRFNLLILLDGAEVYRTDGSTNFILSRSDTTSNWQILSWRDESEI